MAQRCPECGAAVDGAPWCGACGARLGEGTDRGTPSSDTGRRMVQGTAAVVAVVAAMGVVGVVAGVVTRGGSPDGEAADGAAGDPAAVDQATVVTPVLPSSRPVVGRQFATEAETLWERVDLPPMPRDATVVPAGERHVLVGGHLVATTASSADVDLGALPDPIRSSAFAPDGTWAIAELDRVVVGCTDAPGTNRIAVDGAWTPIGAAVAWRDGEPVLAGTDGHLARVRPDGTTRWRTALPVLSVGPVGDRWSTGRREDGTPVAISLDDGRPVPLAAVPGALHGDVAVIVRDEVVARDLTTGEVLWRRPDDGSTWRTVGDHLVAVAAGGAARVDPRTGAERGSITGAGLVPTAEGAVEMAAGGLRAVAWDGGTSWTVSLEEGAAHRLDPVDAGRVAVTSEMELGTRVTILAASDGTVLATATAPAVADRALAAEGEVVAVVTPDGPIMTVDVATGMDVEASVPPAGPQDLSFPAGDGTVVVTAGTTTLRGATAGEEVWTLVLEAPLSGPPIRSGPTLVVGLVDGTVAAIDPLRGALRWRQDLGVLPTAVAGDGTVLLVGTADGRVLRLDPDGRPVTSTDLGEGAVLSLAGGRPAAALLGDRLVGFDVAG